MWKLTFQIYRYFLLKTPSTKIILPTEIIMLLGIGQVTSLRIHFLGFFHKKVINSVQESKVFYGWHHLHDQMSRWRILVLPDFWNMNICQKKYTVGLNRQIIHTDILCRGNKSWSTIHFTNANENNTII